MDHNGSTTYEQVLHRKQYGTMTLSESSLTFRSMQGVLLMHCAWTNVAKHQVSPASYPKSLLKLVLTDDTNKTFQLINRQEIDRIRGDITKRLQFARTQSTGISLSGNKRRFSEVKNTAFSFGELDSTALAVARSSLLASNPSLRQQHNQLVQESQTVAEEDFWETHKSLLEEEYAKISGLAKAGTSSLMQSHLPTAGRVTLGVEEMRQIFILYPAVHRAYEEKVPLELSDEQFWKKYLESEYFHRDRGRIGTVARNQAPTSESNANQTQTEKKAAKKSTGLSVEEQEARAAVVGTDDLFSRYDQKLQEESGDTSVVSHRRWGRKLAVGQFDLAATLETERGHLLEGPKDNHPSFSTDDNGKGSRVIQKYNRHWAMVLHPDAAVAGANLTDVARRSVGDVVPDDDDAKAAGGYDEEMRRLVDFANAAEEQANHAVGLGLLHDEYEQLTLRNVEAYYAGQLARSKRQTAAISDEETAKRHAVFAKAMAAKANAWVEGLKNGNSKGTLPNSSFPAPEFGRELLSALTKKMAQDARTEAASLEMVHKLPEDFRKKLQSYFRRSSELLRHFFALRRIEAQQQALVAAGHSSTTGQKLLRIVRAMETFYREMEGMRKDLPQSEIGVQVGKMCRPIMDQLDWAFKLYREGSSGGGSGGFVTVDEL